MEQTEIREEIKKHINFEHKKHFASMSSPKLQRMLYFLKDKKKHTQFEIIIATHDTAFNQTIQALRHHGYNIVAEFKGVSKNGGKIFEYQLIGGKNDK